MAATQCRQFDSVTLMRIGLMLALLGPGLSMAAEVVGTVFQGGRPVANVPVSLGQFSTQTDSTGRFLVRGVPPGSYALRCGSAPPVTVQILDGLNQVTCRTQ